ncbi:MAG: prolipoprotein diacylglyceryl transferase [Clostridia bacterium]|nr:prolipoprotein diacylglyceryl transferase [Clostridia bacterium]
MSVYDVVLFGIRFRLNPIAFTLPIGENGWNIYWYGIIIATGFFLAIVYAYFNSKRFNLDNDKILDVVLVATPVAILSARAYYLIFDGVKLDSIGDFFGFGDSSGFSGLAIYGGVIGAFVSGAVMCYIKKIKVFDLFDIAAIGFLIGQGVGRWGNFMNQEAYGDFTNSAWWGMQSNKTIAEMGEGLVHPCFLYESVWCLVGVLLLHLISKNRSFSGQIILSYGVWYGFGRAIIETLRTDSLMIGPIRVSCLLSILLCLASLTAIIVIKKKLNKPVEEYISILKKKEETENE